MAFTLSSGMRDFLKTVPDQITRTNTRPTTNTGGWGTTPGTSTIGYQSPFNPPTTVSTAPSTTAPVKPKKDWAGGLQPSIGWGDYTQGGAPSQQTYADYQANKANPVDQTIQGYQTPPAGSTGGWGTTGTTGTTPTISNPIVKPDMGTTTSTTPAYKTVQTKEGPKTFATEQEYLDWKKTQGSANQTITGGTTSVVPSTWVGKLRMADGTVKSYTDKSAYDKDKAAMGGLPAANQGVQAGTETVQRSTTTPPTTKTDIATDPFYANVNKETTQMMLDLVNQNSDIPKKIANLAFGNLDPRLQANVTLTAMQIANNPEMTDGAKRAMMAGAIRDAGIAQGDLAASLAKDALNMTTQAIQWANSSAQWSMNFEQQKTQWQSTEGWKAFEYASQYGTPEDAAARYKEMTGKDMDPQVLKDLQTNRRNGIAMDTLNLQALRNNIGDSRYNSLVNKIGTGATYENLLAEYPTLTKPQYDSIYNAGPLGNRDLSILMNNVTMLLDAKNFDQAAKILNEKFPDLDINFADYISDENSADFKDGMDTLSRFVASGSQWEDILPAINKSGLLEKLGMDENVVKTMYEQLAADNTPVGRLINTIGMSTLKEWFPGESEDAITSNLKKLVFRGGVQMDDDENFTVDSDVWSEVFEEKAAPKGSKTESEMYNDFLDSVPEGEETTFKDWVSKGKPAEYKTTDWPEVALGADSAHAIDASSASQFGARASAYLDSSTGKWVYPTPGQYYNFTSNLTATEMGYTLPAGKYQFKEIGGYRFWVNANDTDKIYPAVLILTNKVQWEEWATKYLTPKQKEFAETFYKG